MYKNNNFILAIWLSNYVHSERSFLGIQKPIHSIPKPEALCQSTSLLFILSIIWPLQASGLSKKIPIRSATTIKGHLHKEDITGYHTPISDMDFQFLAILAAQGRFFNVLMDILKKYIGIL